MAIPGLSLCAGVEGLHDELADPADSKQDQHKGGREHYLIPNEDITRPRCH